MKSFAFLPFALFLVLAGCGSNNADNPNFDPNAKATKLETTPDSQAVLQQASQVARSATGGWDTLSAEQRDPFLKLNGGDEKRAKSHYTTLVENEKEIQANLSRG